MAHMLGMVPTVSTKVSSEAQRPLTVILIIFWRKEKEPIGSRKRSQQATMLWYHMIMFGKIGRHFKNYRPLWPLWAFFFLFFLDFATKRMSLFLSLFFQTLHLHHPSHKAWWRGKGDGLYHQVSFEKTRSIEAWFVEPKINILSSIGG